MTKNAPKPPEWFAGRDYCYLRDLDARGWLTELERLSTRFDPIDGDEWGDALGCEKERLQDIDSAALSEATREGLRRVAENPSTPGEQYDAAHRPLEGPRPRYDLNQY